MTSDPPSEADAPPSSGITVISMKSPVGLDAAPRAPVVPVKREVTIRALAEVDGRSGPTPKAIGNLAPPRDEAAARGRGMRFALGWSLVALLLAGVVSVAIYFVATRTA